MNATKSCAIGLVAGLAIGIAASLAVSTHTSRNSLADLTGELFTINTNSDAAVAALIANRAQMPIAAELFRVRSGHAGQWTEQQLLSALRVLEINRIIEAQKGIAAAQ